MLYALAFFILAIGGMTGIMLGSVGLDLQVHDTCFVVLNGLPLYAVIFLAPRVHRSGRIHAAVRLFGRTNALKTGFALLGAPALVLAAQSRLSPWR